MAAPENCEVPISVTVMGIRQQEQAIAHAANLLQTKEELQTLTHNLRSLCQHYQEYDSNASW